jgi:type VI secretion system secreted protein Hcp
MTNNPAGVESPTTFLKIVEIKGDSRSPNHADEIEVTGWSWGETQSVFPSEARKAGGSVSMRDFQFTARTNAASPQFLLMCASAKKLKSAVFSCEHDHKGGKHTYLTITLTNVVIGSYNVQGVGEDVTDTITLKFTKIEFTYTPMKDGKPGSNFSSSWDLSLAPT